MNSLWMLLASIALIRSTLYNYMPESLRLYISSRFQEWTGRFTTEETMVFRDYQSSKMNQLFEAANLYLGESLQIISIPRVTVEKTESVRNLTFSMEKNTEMIDVFEHVPMKWKYFTDYNQGMSKHEIRWYELSFHRECKAMVTKSYLPHILERADKIKERNRVVQLHTAVHDFWTPKPVIIQHPMTFETLAMNGNLKKELVEDLDRFMNGKEYYRQIGKVWRRGYLLYGPPGTGKSSLIAAMANHLNFDIYNLNLSAVSSDLNLQNLLLSMANRSILVIEDIDCYIKLQNRESGIEQPIKFQHQNKVTLSGLLNFFDGILSCCGEGKILVATTNHKDRIDPALLRAGRIDMHVHLTYCTFSAFKQLALKYLEISDHTLFHHIEKLIPDVKVSPAEVSGELMKTRDPKASLEGLIKHLEGKLIADGNSGSSPRHVSSPSQTSYGQFHESSTSLRQTSSTFGSTTGIVTTSESDPSSNITNSRNGFFNSTSSTVTNTGSGIFGGTSANTDKDSSIFGCTSSSTPSSMAEDTVQASPTVPTFGQPPFSPPASGFSFGASNASGATSFQFGPQPSMATPQIPFPFQASSSLKFGTGGNFSMRSGGGDKSGRKWVKVRRKQLKK